MCQNSRYLSCPIANNYRNIFQHSVCNLLTYIWWHLLHLCGQSFLEDTLIFSFTFIKIVFWSLHYTIKLENERVYHTIWNNLKQTINNNKSLTKQSVKEKKIKNLNLSIIIVLNFWIFKLFFFLLNSNQKMKKLISKQTLPPTIQIKPKVGIVRNGWRGY